MTQQQLRPEEDRPFDGIDLCFMIGIAVSQSIVPLSIVLLLLGVLQYGVRRSPVAAMHLLTLTDWTPADAPRWLLPAAALLLKEQPAQTEYPLPSAQAPIVATPAALPPLLPALDQAQRVLIIGASNAGKTTLLRHILDRRQNVLVLDPHAYPGKWGSVRVVGAGRNYEAIRVTLGWLISTMQRRYDEIARGEVREGYHPPMTILVDEWRAIVRNIPARRADPELSGSKAEPGAGEQIAALLTESRKAAMSMIVASHSDRVKAMGLEGEGDLRDGFTLVRLKLVGDERSCTVDDGDGPVAYTLPGAYVERVVSVQPVQRVSDNAVLLSSLLSDTAVTSGNGHGNDGNEGVTALESDVTSSLPVTVTMSETAKIATLLATLPPSEVIKKLDGYSPRKYRECKAKVEAVQEMLAGG